MKTLGQCRVIAQLDGLAAKQAEAEAELAAFTPALLAKAFGREP